MTASSVADKDGALGTRYFEVTASPSPSSGRRSRPPASLACFPTDRPPALPAPRSWHSLRSLDLGLGLRCLVPSGHGHVSLSSPGGRVPAVSAALPGLGNTRRAKHAGDLNSHTHSLFFCPLSFVKRPRRKRDSGCGDVGGQARHFQDFCSKTVAWRSRYILTETCIWIEHFAIHGACLLAPGTQAWRDLGPVLEPGD